MIPASLRRFVAARRSAVALTMAVSILPLMLLVGIAIDFTLLSQARSQAAFAAQAAATHAVRVAASTYALEVQNGSTTDVAVAHARAAANTSGDLWWGAELGALSQGYVSFEQTYTTSTNDSSSPPNFTAKVSYTITYPPIFDPLFGQPTTKWVYASNASATAQYAYAQILLMLDTSNSMLIGADTSDVTKMELGSVCPAQGTILGTDTGNQTTGLTALSYGLYDPTPDSSDNDFVDLTQVSTYNAKSKTDISSLCKNNYGIGGAKLYGGNGNVLQPPNACALACHNTTTKVNGNYGDLYGLARSEGVTLRLDILFSATEQIIQDMYNGEAVNNQFSIGVYQFNTDALKIVDSKTGTTATNSPPEATTDLTSALTAVKAVDFKQTPTETAIPLLQNNSTTYSNTNLIASPEVTAEGSDTNLAGALNDLVTGKLPTGTQAALTATGQGDTIKTPQKFIFIVTDGMNDINTSNGGTETGAVAGEMTSIAAEKAGTGSCSAIKKLGYTVYVLYVTYDPLDDYAYYNPLINVGTGINAATNSDYPSNTPSSAQALSEVSSIPVNTQFDSNGNDKRYSTSPDGLALQACASGAADFYTASSSTAIQTALNKMLKSALASTTRLTN